MAGDCEYIILTFKVHREENQYVSSCVELGISSCAKTLDQAFQRIMEATTLYLNTLDEVGERERVFRECGIQVMSGEPAQEVSVSTRPDREFVSLHRVRLPALSYAS